MPDVGYGKDEVIGGMDEGTPVDSWGAGFLLGFRFAFTDGIVPKIPVNGRGADFGAPPRLAFFGGMAAGIPGCCNDGAGFRAALLGGVNIDGT